MNSIWAIAVVVCSLGAFIGGIKLEGNWRDAANAKRVAAELLAENRDRLMRMEKNYVIGQKAAQTQARERVVTQTIIERVREYVPVNSPLLPGAWRVFHDAAAEGVDPRTRSVDHAAPADLETASVTIATNYSAGRENAEQVLACQEYVRNVVRPEGMN